MNDDTSEIAESTKKKREKEFVPPSVDRKNVVERSKTYLLTATATDKVRQAIELGVYQDSKLLDAYLHMHHLHVSANPLGVYTQEKEVAMGGNASVSNSSSGDPEAGEIRSGEAQIGSFYFIEPKELPLVVDEYFGKLDELFTKESFLQSLSTEQKVLILALVDEVLTLGHFVKDGSGRTNEDFLSLLAKRMGLTFTISQTGFRGQIDSDLELKVETARWNVRNSASYRSGADDKGDGVHSLATSKALVITKSLSELSTFARNNDPEGFTRKLSEVSVADDGVVAKLAKAMVHGVDRKYYALPADATAQGKLASLVAHVNLYLSQPVISNQDRSMTLAYLNWHNQEAKKLIADLSLNSTDDIRAIIEIAEKTLQRKVDDNTEESKPRASMDWDEKSKEIRSLYSRIEVRERIIRGVISENELEEKIQNGKITENEIRKLIQNGVLNEKDFPKVFQQCKIAS